MNATTIILLIFMSYSIFLNLEFLPKRTERKKVKIGYFVHYRDSKFQFHLYIPIRNNKKIELAEEVEYLKTLNLQSKMQILKAKVNLCKKQKEVRRFARKYMQVDSDIVKKLVQGFTDKNK
jgi:hypothetical protein